jgi:hypothetical protein
MKIENQKSKVKNIICFFLIAGLILPGFSFGQQESFQTPETLEEAKEMGEKALETGKEKLPGILEKVWEEEILPVWERMYNWFMVNVWPGIENWFKKEVEPRVKEEVEKRKPIIEEEFQKEKEEAKEELPEVTKSLWERFKELIK